MSGLTYEEAREALLAGRMLRYEVEPGHVMHVWHEDSVVYAEAQMPAWSAGVVEPVCGIDRDFLRTYFLDREVTVADGEPPIGRR
jgi:hypothetical protein